MDVNICKAVYKQFAALFGLSHTTIEQKGGGKEIWHCQELRDKNAWWHRGVGVVTGGLDLISTYQHFSLAIVIVTNKIYPSGSEQTIGKGPYQDASGDSIAKEHDFRRTKEYDIAGFMTAVDVGSFSSLVKGKSWIPRA